MMESGCFDDAFIGLFGTWCALSTLFVFPACLFDMQRVKSFREKSLNGEKVGKKTVVVCGGCAFFFANLPIIVMTQLYNEKMDEAGYDIASDTVAQVSFY